VENRQRIDKNKLQYNFYYYSSEGQFKINVKTFLVYGLVFSASMIIMSVDQLLKDGRYFELGITTIVFILILIMIRRLNN